MQTLNMLIEAPDYISEVQVAKGTLPSRERLAEQIDAAIKKAAADGTLTTAQILVAKINAIPDDATPVELERQSELLKELVSTQPLGFTEYLGYEVFFKHKRYRAAIACFKRSLESNSGDADSHLRRLRPQGASDAAAALPRGARRARRGCRNGPRRLHLPAPAVLRTRGCAACLQPHAAADPPRRSGSLTPLHLTSHGKRQAK